MTYYQISGTNTVIRAMFIELRHLTVTCLYLKASKGKHKARSSHRRVLNCNAGFWSCYVFLWTTDLTRRGREGQKRRSWLRLGEAECIIFLIERPHLVYSGCCAGVSLALLSVILFSSSSSDRRSKEVPSTWSWRLPERLEEKVMGPPRLQVEDKRACLSFLKLTCVLRRRSEGAAWLCD